MCENEHRWESVSDYGTRADMFSYSDSEFDDEDYDDFYETASENSFDMAGSLVEVLGTTPRMGRRSMALADIDPKYVSQSGIWEASEVETSRGSIRIQHLTAVTTATRPLSCATSSGAVAGPSRIGTRFPKLEDCAHFHYDILELPVLKVKLRNEPSKYASSIIEEETSGSDNLTNNSIDFSIEVCSGSHSWVIKRTYANFKRLDEQLHRCVWDRNFSQLGKVVDFFEDGENKEEEQDFKQKELVRQYLDRLNELPTDQITCGTVLSWLEIDNRGRHIVSRDDSAINTPAVAAACATRAYVAKASDELSFEVGNIISVIDMPPPEESSWWRGKLKFSVGFFPHDYVQVIKVPGGLPNTPTRKQQRLSSISSTSSSTTASPTPDKPVLRKHGKLIAFFRSFILSRPSRRSLKETGILRERVFGCDLAEHLLNTGSDVPVILTCCAEFIELEGIVDGIYRVSGITSNIQKLRNAFDEDRVPNLAEDEAIKQDIHAVSSLLKMYFRELPNPLCTYQLYNKFREAIEACDEDRLLRIREVAQELPPPHYRTLEYLLKHLARVASQSSQTGMTARNMAIVWAPNLIRCKDLEAGGVTALKGIGVQAIVTEYLVRHADLIFNDLPPHQLTSSNKSLKSLPLSPPIKFLSLDEQTVDQDDRKFIEVGGGPSSLSERFIIEVPGRRSSLKSKRSATGWKTFFSRNRSFSKPHRKINKDIVVGPPTNVQHLQHLSHWPGLPLRPVKSVESLVSSTLYQASSLANRSSTVNDTLPELDETVVEDELTATELSQVNNEIGESVTSDSSADSQKLQNQKTHNRSISHDSYFEFGEFLKKASVFIDETVEEEEDDSESLTNNDIYSDTTVSPRKELSSGVLGDTESVSPGTRQRSSIGNSSLLPNTSCNSLGKNNESFSSDEPASTETDENVLANSPLIKPKPRYSILRNQNSESSSSKKLMESDTMSSQYSEGSDIYRSYEHALNTCHIHRDFSLPLDKDLTNNSNVDNNPYEIDRNSSFDNSSTDTTPGVETIGTNIIYSPLVNDNEPNAPLPDSHLLKFTEKDIPSPVSSVFVCPLFESGASPTTEPKVNKSSQPIERTSGTSVEHKKSFRTQIRQYENIEILVPSTEEDCFVSNEETSGVWNQERIYQNIGQHLVSGTSEEIYLQQEVRVIHIDGNSVQPIAEADEEEVEDENEEYEQHYENVATRELASPDDLDENLYETNIYEDIDDDDEKSICHNSGRQSRPPSLPNRNNNRSPDPRESCMSNTSDVGEAYESIQFGGNSIMSNSYPCGYTESDCYAEVGQLQKEMAALRDSEKQSSYHGQDQINCQPSSFSDVKENSLQQSSKRNEIRHIDSPVLFGNPLYGVEFQESLTQNTKSESDDNESKEKSVGRSNSVPLIDSLNNVVQGQNNNMGETQSLPTDIPQNNNELSNSETRRLLVDSKDVNIIDSEMLLLWKRLSEPSLAHIKKEDKKAALEAWRLADAKRLANRKQSVKELLSKFEQKDSLSPSASPTNINLKSARSSPGLPRPESKQNNSNNNNLRQGQTNAKFQHHRFSVGDILMTQSLSLGDESNNQSVNYSLMSRSDTFPELRTESSKENDVGIEESSTAAAQPSILVPEKIQSAIRVAMSSVDMNDPNTRDRIEKYKEERRLFLRQKLGTETGDLPKGCYNSELIKAFELKTGVTNSAERSFNKTSSDNYSDNVVLQANLRNANVTEEQIKSCIDSPRKRAFSEDAHQGKCSVNQNKAIKTENPASFENNNQLASNNVPSTSLTLSSANLELVSEEINVREKVALWSTAVVGSVEKKPYSSPYVDSLQRSTTSRSKPILVERCSLPVEPTMKISSSTGAVQPPVTTGLRRELTTGSIDMEKLKLSTKVNNLRDNKKIKDMAAFFEGKHF